MKYTVIVVSYDAPSIFIVHTDKESALEASRFVCEHAMRETGIFSYETEAIFEGHITPINLFNDPYFQVFNWE